MSGMSNTEKNAVLDSLLVTGWLALTTLAVVGSDTGGTITEPGYTGYARIEMKNTDWAAAAEGKKHNNLTKAFAECTAGEGTVVGWALCLNKTKGEAGKVIWDGSIPATVVKAGIVPEFLANALIAAIADS